MTGPPRFLTVGEAAISVEFGDRIDPGLSDRVLALAAALRDDPVTGVTETVPTYRALLVHFDPFVLPRDRLIAHLTDLARQPEKPAAVGDLWHLPACLDATLAADLDHIATTTGQGQDQVRRLFLGATYRIAMFGFAPGWAYLSGLPAELTLPRRASPRDRIAAGSLIIAGGQAIVAGPAMPSGWHILGQTAARLFDPARQPPIPMQPGDRLRFDPVDLPTHTALMARATAGEPLIRRAGA